MHEMPGDLPSWPNSTPAARATADAAAEPAGALTFDASRSRVTSINAALRARLGLSNRDTGESLDAAMPALVRLRELARTGALADGAIEERLLFWSRMGALRLPCRMSTGSGLHIIQVEIEALPAAAAAVNGHATAAVTISQPANDPQAEPIEEPPPAARDDAATLREIGQRIRNGIRSSAEVAELAAANDRVALPDYLVPAVSAPTPEPRPAATANQAWREPQAAQPSVPVSSVTEPIPPDATAALPSAFTEAQLAALLSRTAHEIKTPLSAIAAASEVIRDEHLGPVGSTQYREYAGGIHANARHALDVVDRLLKAPLSEPPRPAVETAAALKTELVKHSHHADIGRPKPEELKIATPKLGVSHADATVALPVQAPHLDGDLNVMIEAVAREMQPLAGRAGVRLSAWPDPAVTLRVADATELKQTLLNLVTNAIKFTPDGGTISLETQDMASDGAGLIVRDTGRGMTRAMAARLANPALDPNPGRKTETGYGLGYTQIRAFAAGNGAQLTIDSILGKGTCVTLVFADGKRSR